MLVDIGIMAYNEELNIGQLLRSLTGKVSNIYVVASGCSDKTVEIAQSLSAIVLQQPTREGKASAINLFLLHAKSDLLILCSADVLPSDFCLKYLLEPFSDPKVGMVGAHPIPVNSLKTPMGRVCHLLWSTHHHMALRWPKMGEVCVFRNVVTNIDNKTAVDEAYLESVILKLGYRIVYAPKAVVFNKGPETIFDFIKQRSRVYCGHLSLKHASYEVPTMNAFRVFGAAPKKDLCALLRLCCLEFVSRRKAQKMSQPTIWDISTTTKVIK